MVDGPQLPEASELNLPDAYEIVSIRAVAPPEGTSGANWHRYEISQGGNTIVGYRAGAAEFVRDPVCVFAACLGGLR